MMIERDLTCSGCGYNLRGLTPEGNCPECGKSIHEALEQERWLKLFPGPRHIRLGAYIWIWSQLITISLGAASTRLSLSDLLLSFGSPAIINQPKSVAASALWSWHVIGIGLAFGFATSCWLLAGRARNVWTWLRFTVRWGAILVGIGAVIVHVGGAYPGDLPGPYRLSNFFCRTLEPLLALAVAAMLLQVSKFVPDLVLEFMCTGLMLLSVLNTVIWLTHASFDYLAIMKSSLSVPMLLPGAMAGILFLLTMLRLAWSARKVEQVDPKP
jgi:hypothetical protein